MFEIIPIKIELYKAIEIMCFVLFQDIDGLLIIMTLFEKKLLLEVICVFFLFQLRSMQIELQR